jgi:hypothetical protein
MLIASQYAEAAVTTCVMSDDVGITNGGGLLQGILPEFSLRDGGKEWKPSYWAG